MSSQPVEPRRHRVVIIGSGFGGLTAAQKLKGADVDITLIADTSHHLFQPLLYQVATGILSVGEIAPATRLILRKQRTSGCCSARWRRSIVDGRHGDVEAHEHGDGRRVRQHRRGRGRAAVLLRQRPFRDVRARHEDHRQRPRAARAHPRRVRGRRGHHRPGRARPQAHVRRRRRGPHRSRGRRSDRRARRTHPGRRVPDDRAERLPRDPARRRARGAPADGCEAGRQGAAPTREAWASRSSSTRW